MIFVHSTTYVSLLLTAFEWWLGGWGRQIEGAFIKYFYFYRGRLKGGGVYSMDYGI